MQTDLRGRDLISLQEWTKDEIDTVLDVAFDLKRKRALGEPHPLLRDRVLAMLFFFSSTRTRASFEAGMAQLGGHAQFIESRTTQIAHGDTAREIGEILGRYNDGIAIRNVDWGVGNRYIREVAEASAASPSSTCSATSSIPHQSLADLMTIIEKKGDPRGRTITVSWAYAASYQKPISVPQDLILAATRYGMNVRLVHPPEFELMPDIVGPGRATTPGAAGGSLELMDDFDAGIRGVGRRLREELGRPAARQGRGGRRRDREPVHGLDHRRAPDGDGRGGRDLHASAAGRPERRGRGRGHRRAAVRRLRRGREPPPRAEGGDGADDAMTADDERDGGHGGRRVERSTRGLVSKTLVVAIGGNSLIRDPQHMTVPDQYAALGETSGHIAAIIRDGWRVAIGHGNGPQVGFILRRSELAAHELHEVPLDVCGADTQGAIGYELQQNLANDFRRMGMDRQAVTVVTQVEVAADDPAFASPSKPIGSFMDEATALRRRDIDGWSVREDAGRGWRRVVPSPKPIRIVEEKAVRALLHDGFVVITVGRRRASRSSATRRASSRASPPSSTRTTRRRSWRPRSRRTCSRSAPPSSGWRSTGASRRSASSIA